MPRPTPTRRQFLSTAAAAALLRAQTVTPASVKIAVLSDAAIGEIRPELHSHFAEHLGNCTYNGLWVGPNSPIPNIAGYRRDAVTYLKALGIPVLRWPGGCFADDYHWRDGIGPAAKRPRRVNLWWGQYTEDNSFGTHEFLGLCKLIGAEPYLAGNVGSGTPAELRDWMEYCNFPSGSTLSDERISNGAREPFAVKYWGVGNENWGCGGHMSPEEYAANYKRYSNYLTPRGGIGNTRAFLIACGPNRNDIDWSRRFFAAMGNQPGSVNGFAMHFYSNGKKRATDFDVESMREQLSSFTAMESAIRQQHALLRAIDPAGRVGLLVDEWGVWDRIPPEDEQRYGKLWQQITMRSAVAAAMGLNVFHRHADKLVMCNIAQIVNVLHSLLLTDGPQCVRTSTYYAYEMMKRHRGATALRIEAADAGPLGLSVSASRRADQLHLTLVNPKHGTPLSVTCSLPGVTAVAPQAVMLHHADWNACNTFTAPDTIVPKPHTVELVNGSLSVAMPPLSIVSVTVRA